ncbi:HEAT repeat domain-containing protein, partial [bacterium]|nr:HEAT repeat domain-containing protein [bacterium]
MISDSEQIKALSSSVKSFRLELYDQIIKDGCSEEVFNALTAQLPKESDEECWLFLSYAISAAQKRFKKKQKANQALKEKEPAEGSISEENFPETFCKLEVAKKIDFLADISPDSLPKLAVQAPDLLEKEGNPSVCAAIIKTFAKNWPPQRLDQFSARLLSPHLSTRLASLDSLISRSPQMLTESLPKLLTSDDPRTRAMAIRGLACIDMEEAVNHLDFFLSSPEPDEKIAALKNCFILPFEEIKPILMKFISGENDPNLLQSA